MAITSRNSAHKGRKWKLIRRHLEADVDQLVTEHLIRKRQGEPAKAFAVRREIGSYLPHFAKAVTTLGGMVIGQEEDESRTWWDDGELGGPEVDGSVMASFWHDTDGRGTNWSVMTARAIIRLCAYQKIWGIVDGIQRPSDAEGAPSRADAMSNGRIRVLSPLDVTDWVTDATGRLVEVAIRHERDVRTSVEQDETIEEEYHVYTLDGVVRYTRDDDTGEWVRGTVQPYFPNGRQYMGRDGRPTLPIWCTDVPIDTDVGYVMAREATWLFNFRNARNFHLWASCIARAYTDATDANGQYDEQMWEQIKKLMKESTLFPQKIGYAAPPMDGVEARNETLDKEIENFYTVFFQSYGDAARQKTATEIMQDIAEGVAAYLRFITSSIDEWEQEALYRFAQVHRPSAGAEAWGEATVERSKEYDVTNIAELIREVRESFFGPNKIAADATALADASRKIMKKLGVAYEDDRIEEIAEDIVSSRSQGASLGI